MASYDIKTRNGNIVTVPDFAVLSVDGLIIIGDQTQDWNEPYNINFLALDKKIKNVEDSINNVNDTELPSINTSITAIQTELNDAKIAISSNSIADAQHSASLNTLVSRVEALITTVSTKVDKVTGKQLSTNDYTDLEKTKLESTYTKTEVDAKIVELAPATDITGKADINHTHSILDVNGLEDVIDSKISYTSLNTLDLGEM